VRQNPGGGPGKRITNMIGISMDSGMTFSIGTAIASLTFFYAWHKDSKETTKQIQKLETEVEQLKEHKQDIRDLKREFSELKDDVVNMSNTLARVDTNVSHLMQQQQHNN